MSGFKVEYADLAVESLRKIRRYIIHNLMNPEAAVRQTERIMSACETLAVFPRMHRVRKIDSHGRELRFFPIDSYVILYSVDDVAEVVNILNVIHSRRNIDAMI